MSGDPGGRQAIGACHCTHKRKVHDRGRQANPSSYSHKRKVHDTAPKEKVKLPSDVQKKSV